MEARLVPIALAMAALVACGAGARSQNFIVQAPTPQLAEEICRAAETFRRDLAIEWLGEELPPWNQPCPINAQVRADLGAGGATSFMFDPRSQPFGWQMDIQGSRERVLDSVLPHEITHTIFATYFGRPLPRWADEGACTTVEHPAEKAKQEKFLVQFLMTDRGIPFNKMFAMKEYPPDILPLYSQGYSLARYLIQQGGKKKFVQFVGEGMQTNRWPATTKKFYGFKDLSELQVTWVEWVRAGSPDLDPALVAANDPNATQPIDASNVIPAQPVSVITGESDPKVLGTQSKAHGYVRPARPTNVPAAKIANNGDARSSNVARPNSSSWYTKPRDGSQAQPSRGPAAKPAVYDPRTQSPPRPATNKSTLNPAAESDASPRIASRDRRQVLLEWSRPADQPWSPESLSSASVADAPPPTPISAITARPAMVGVEPPPQGTTWR